jgi:hypothetical protein
MRSRSSSGLSCPVGGSLDQRRTSLPARQYSGRNLVLVRALGGPRRFAKIIASISREHDRVSVTAAMLDQVGAKGALDLLMGLGLIRNSIALDRPVVNSNALRAAGVTGLKKAPSDREAYGALEKQVIENVAMPLGQEPVLVDRTLFQRTKAVLAAL